MDYSNAEYLLKKTRHTSITEYINFNVNKSSAFNLVFK